MYMSKKQLFYSAIILVVLCFVCHFIYHNFKLDSDKVKTEILVSNQENCSNGLTLYYTDKDNHKYYLYCLDQITVDYKDHVISLDRALDTRQITIDKLLNEYLPVSFTEVYKDGGSTKYFSDQLSIIACNTIEGNQDYYFGPKDMEYQEGFCIKDAYICSFTRTYQILDVSESNDEINLYVTLKSFQGEEVVTVKIFKDLASDIEEENYYEFTFASSGKGEEDIRSIFQNHRLLGIKKTELTGLEQINENICK